MREVGRRLRAPRGLIEIIRGPRQVGKTTGVQQIIEELLSDGISPGDVLFVRFDLEVLRDEPAALEPRQRLALRRALERYYVRGGYPRLHSGEVGDDHWADYLTQTVFENVLGSDIPDLFPVRSPGLLRFVYLQVAWLTGQEIAQNQLTEVAIRAGHSANQVTVGQYLHYLAVTLGVRPGRPRSAGRDAGPGDHPRRPPPGPLLPGLRGAGEPAVDHPRGGLRGRKARLARRASRGEVPSPGAGGGPRRPAPLPASLH